MAAILKLRRGSSFSSPQISEPFFNTDDNTLLIGTSGSTHITLVKIGSNAGSIEFSGDITGSNLSLSGNANITGNITLGGTIILGDGDDKIIVNSSLSGSLIPDIDDEYDLGANDKRYANLYVTSASIDNLSVGGSGILSSSSENFVDYSSSIDSKIISITAFTQSIDGRVTTLETTFSSSVDSRLDDLELFSSSLDDTYATEVELNNATASLSASIEITDSNQNDRLNSIEIFTASVDSNYEEKASSTHTLVSGSSQIDVNNTQNFTPFSSSVVSILDSILYTALPGFDTRIDNLETFSESLDASYEEKASGTHTLVSGSSQIDHDSTTNFVANEHIDHSTVSITSGNGISGGGDITTTRTLTLNTGSTHFNNGVKTKLNVEGVLSGSSQILGGSGILSSSNENFTTFSSSIDDRVVEIETTFSTSVDSRLDTLEGDSHTHSNKANLDTIDQDLSTTSDVAFNNLSVAGTGSFANSVTVYGNLTVFGTESIINSENLAIGDNMIYLNSGSTITNPDLGWAGNYNDGGYAHAGFFRDSSDGIFKVYDSYTPDPEGNIDTSHASFRYADFNANDISASSFTGDGSNLTNVTAADVEYSNVLNKPTLVSGSSQVTSSLDTRYLEINGDSVVSGSSQIDVNNTQNFTTFSSSIDDRVDTLETTFSTSVDDRLDLLESHSESLDESYEEKASSTHTLVSGSSQIDVTQTTNIETLATTGSNIFIGNQVITGSLLVSGAAVQLRGFQWPETGSEGIFLETQDYELNLNGSGSRDYGGFKFALEHREEGLDYYHNSFALYSYATGGFDEWGTEFNVGPIRNHLRISVSGSDEMANLSVEDNLDSTSKVKIYGTSVNIGRVSTDYIILGNTGSITYLRGSQINVESPIDSDSPITASFFVGDGSYLTNITASVISYENIEGLPNGIVSGSSQIDLTQTTNYESGIKDKLDVEGVISSSIVNTDTQGTFTASINGTETYIDLGLETTDSPTFNGLTLSGLNTTGSEFTALFLSSSNEIVKQELATAAFYHVSNSIENGDDDVVGSAGAMKRYIDDQFLLAGAGDITRVVAGDGMSGGADSGSATLTLDTGSQHFTDGIKTKLNVETVISGSSQVQIEDVSGFTTFSSSVDTRIDSLESFSSSLDDGFVTHAELASATESLENSIDVKLDTGSYNTDSSSFDGRIDSLEGETHENPLTFADTSTIDFTRVSDTITADVIGGVVSGSSQVIGILDSLNTYTSSTDIRLNSLELETGSITTEQSVQDGRLTSLETYTGSVDSLYEEKASGTHTLVSGSDQLTGSLVDLTSNQTISGTKTFNDIVVNGTGSFAYITSVTGSSKIIGDAFVVVNNDAPAQRYAGLAVYDSGSANTTASLQFDGQTNDWFYSYDDGAIDYGVVLFGPEYSTKGSPTYPTNNTIQKGSGGHHLLDSNITDNGTTITLGSNTSVNGNITVTGNVDGIDLQSFSSSVDSRIDTLEGETHENPLTFNDTTTIDFIRSTDTITANVIGGVVSGSSQVTLSSAVGYDTLLRSNADDSASGIITFTNSTQSTSKTTGAVIVTGGVGISKTLNVGEDVVAYASSDRRLKENILPISNPLQKINSIGGYSFEWNEKKQHIYKGKDYGVIAQEIEEILPELVDTRENGYKAVKYDKLVSLLIEGIKELSSEVQELKNQINN